MLRENNVVFSCKKAKEENDHLLINDNILLISKDNFLFFLYGTSVAYTKTNE